MANLKESLSKIALDVHDDDDDEELSMYTSPPRDQSDNASSGSERRVSRNSSAPTHSPIINGFDSPPNHEVSMIYLCFTSLISRWICFFVCVSVLVVRANVYLISISSLRMFLNHLKLLMLAPCRNSLNYLFFVSN